MRVCISTVLSNDAGGGQSGALYGRSEIRNNRGSKRLAAKQVVKTSAARDVLLKDSRSKPTDERQKRRERFGGFIGHLLACGLQIYRCGAEEKKAAGGRRAVPPHESAGSNENCQINTHTYSTQGLQCGQIYTSNLLTFMCALWTGQAHEDRGVLTHSTRMYLNGKVLYIHAEPYDSTVNMGHIVKLSQSNAMNFCCCYFTFIKM